MHRPHLGIYFCTDFSYSRHDRKNVALIGGLIQGIKSFFKQRQESAPKVFKANQLFCIGFFQNCNTDAEFSISSMVITGENIAEEAFQRRLQQVNHHILFTYLFT